MRLFIVCKPRTRRVRPSRDARRGFTLIEALIAFTLTSIIFLAAMTLFDQSRRITRRDLGLNDAQQNGSFAMSQVALDLRKAGFQIGYRSSIMLKYKDAAGVEVDASWDNYQGQATILGAGPAVFTPVLNTDGITLRYGLGGPFLHVCDATGTTLSILDNPGYVTASTYGGVTTGVDTEVDLISDSGNLALYGTKAAPATGVGNAMDGHNLTAAKVNISAAVSPCFDGNKSLINRCYAVDPGCRLVSKVPGNYCHAATGFAFQTPDAPILPSGVAPRATDQLCNVGPTYVVASQSVTYWISTEDKSGNLAVSRPVLMSQIGAGAGAIAGTPRVVATDIEDMQLAYILTRAGANPLGGSAPVPIAANALGYNDYWLGPTTVAPVASSGYNVLADANIINVKAVRVTLLARTGQTDLMYKSKAYCTANAARMSALFSRSAQENHVAPIAAAADYCDGLRRTLYVQSVFLQNTISSPASADN